MTEDDTRPIPRDRSDGKAPEAAPDGRPTVRLVDGRVGDALPGRGEIELRHPTRGLEGYPGVFMPDVDQDREGVAAWRPRARLFVVVFLALFLGQAMGAIAANYVVNPRSDFDTDLFVPLVINDVRVKARLLDERPLPTLLILGSSRSITLPPSAGGSDGSPFNFAISDGNLAEQQAIYEYVVDRHGPPETVLIGLELERLFGEQPVRATVRNSPAGPYAEPPTTRLDQLRTLVETYDRHYLSDTYAAFRYTLTTPPPSNYAFDEDGVRHYLPFEDPERRHEYDREAAIETTLGRLLERMRALGLETALEMPELTRLVAAARSDGVQVELFFTPLHPRLLEAAAETEHPRLHAHARERVGALCGPGVRVHDLTDLASFGGHVDDMYDGWHVVGPSAAAMVATVLAGSADICPVPE